MPTGCGFSRGVDPPPEPEEEEEEPEQPVGLSSPPSVLLGEKEVCASWKCRTRSSCDPHRRMQLGQRKPSRSRLLSGAVAGGLSLDQLLGRAKRLRGVPLAFSSSQALRTKSIGPFARIFCDSTLKASTPNSSRMVCMKGPRALEC